MEINKISGAVINAGMYVHSKLGPGLLEDQDCIPKIVHKLPCDTQRPLR
jgi:hypothetical protein